MNTHSGLRISAAARRGSGWYERLVLRAFAQMSGRGTLTVVMPDGTALLFGGERSGAWQSAVRAPAARALPETALIMVRDRAFFEKCVLFGDIGLAEAYLDGDWHTPDVRAVIAWFLLNLERAPGVSGSGATWTALNLLRGFNRLAHLVRPNSRRRAGRNIREHYDLSNEFFALWLDRSMMYSGARWETPDATLEEAQRAKNEALCTQLRLSAEDHVLEIGSGWGGWAIQAASNFGCRVTTVTLSRQQYALTVRRVAQAKLEHLVSVRLQDYRELPVWEQYDKIVSIEMLEAVGHQYLRDWCRVVSRVLKPEGLMALQFITCPDARYDALRHGVDFIQKHIFPGSLLLSVNRLNTLLAEEGGFVLHRLEDMGQDYARTLRVWRETFATRLEEVVALGFDARFIRKWSYYLAYCEAAFAMRNISVVQTLYTRPNNLSF